MNDPSVHITASIGSPSNYDERGWDEIQRQAAERGKSQRGIPRAKNPSMYPLSCRIVDLTDGCGALMYGYKHGNRPVYVCGAYMRSAGGDCEHNLVDGEATLRFTLKTLRQLVEQHGGRDRLKSLLHERANADRGGKDENAGLVAANLLLSRLTEAREDLATVQRRMALERDDCRYAALASEFDRLLCDMVELDRQAAQSKKLAGVNTDRTLDGEIDVAMALYDDIVRVAADENARTDINPLIVKLGLRLGLNFKEGLKGEKRIVRQLVGGIMTFGDDQLPVPLHGAHNLEAKRG